MIHTDLQSINPTLIRKKRKSFQVTLPSKPKLSFAMCPPAASPHSDDQPTNDASNSQPVPTCIPHDALSQAAYRHAASLLHPLILAHSIRVFLYARQLSEQESSTWHQEPRLPLLLVACIFHDIGTTDRYNSGPTRFEIEGADAAVKFLQQYGVSDQDKHDVWMAIALHDTPQIAERIFELVRLVRVAVMADFKRASAVALFDASTVAAIEKNFERAEIEKVLGDTVVEQALKSPGKAPPACWPGGEFFMDSKHTSTCTQMLI